MRVTNNMMLSKTTGNINSNKESVSYLNNQMSSQKKIDRPSEDPVIAIRALRLRSSLSEINQYYDNNIPDAESWLNTTETAIKNMKNILTDIRTQCVNGANDSLTADDRNTILKQLQALREQVYSEGNADYAGRTVFTGYRTNSNLTFMTDEDETTYTIDQTVDYRSIQENRYYTGQVTVPTSAAGIGTGATTNPTEAVFDRIRLPYSDITGGIKGKDNAGNEQLYSTNGDTFKMSYTANGATTPTDFAVTLYDTMDDWAQGAGGTHTVDADKAVFIKETGELILGKNLSSKMKDDYATIDMTYQKTGFDKGELRPEYYFNCTYRKNPTATDTVEYKKYDDNGKEIAQDINYIVAAGQTLTVNMNGSDVFDASIGRDVDELVNAVQAAIDANNKVSTIEDMMKEEQYAGFKDELQSWLDAAKKEADYADDNMQKLYNTYIGNFDGYLKQVNLAYTTIGSKGTRLDLTKNRVENQQTTIEELKSSNEDKELSDVIIDYTAAYNAYDASLQAASYLNKTSLLNYL